MFLDLVLMDEIVLADIVNYAFKSGNVHTLQKVPSALAPLVYQAFFLF